MTNASATVSARAFISYAWSSPTHESWVLNLASRLREDGVDAILDKWDLKPGHDAYKFMESMVTDPTVTKVIMVCDKTYANKADNRSGGVGAESQIISPELYGKGAQDKFAALITDEDDDGQAHVPVFYRGRIFFDFRSANRFEESYEQLLRWLVDRPQHVKPKLGSVPAAVLQSAPAATATQSRLRRAEDAIRQGAPMAAGLFREYGDALFAELKALAPDIPRTEPDEPVLSAVTAMRPYLRQLSDLVSVVARFGEDRGVWDAVLALHERIGTLMYRDPERTHWNELEFDAHRIFAHEAFLSTVAAALDEGRFDLVEAAVTRPYLVREHDGGNRPSTSDFSVFYQYPRSLDIRNERLKLNRISLQADLLKEAHPAGSIPSYESLMQADFVLYLRSVLDQRGRSWYPVSLVFATNRFSPFPVFARSESRAYFARLAPVLGAESVASFKESVGEVEKGQAASRMFDYHGLPIRYLANVEHIGSVA